MKKILFALALALASTSAFASDGKVSLTVEAASDGLYRGQSFTENRPAVGVGLRLDDLVLDGTFVEVGATTIDVTNLDKDGSLRGEYVVGYGRSFGNVSLAGSVARVENPVLYTQDYTEARLDAAVLVTDKLAVTGQYAQILTDSIGQDRYAALGLEYRGLFVDKLTVGGLVSYQSYKKADRREFNNAEVYGTYALNKHVELFGKYSWGGTSVLHAVDALDVDFAASDLSDQGAVGIRVRF